MKWGITQDIAKRYTQKELAGGKLVPIATGARRFIRELERIMTEMAPGIDNLEPWAK